MEQLQWRASQLSSDFLDPETGDVLPAGMWRLTAIGADAEDVRADIAIDFAVTADGADARAAFAERLAAWAQTEFSEDLI